MDQRRPLCITAQIAISSAPFLSDSSAEAQHANMWRRERRLLQGNLNAFSDAVRNHFLDGAIFVSIFLQRCNNRSLLTEVGYDLLLEYSGFRRSDVVYPE